MILVGGLEPWNFTTFHSVGNFIPTDELIFFRGVGIPPTSNMSKMPKLFCPFRNFDKKCF